jgi:hypothetical protein
MDDVPRGWGELLAAVRRREDGETLPEPEQRAALELAVDLGVAALPGVLDCSVTLLRPDRSFSTPVASGGLALVLDQVQYDLNEGPCVYTAQFGGEHWMVAAQAVKTSKYSQARWPRFAAQVIAHEVGASISLPLGPGREPGAALNLYLQNLDGFQTGPAQEISRVLARSASALLADADNAIGVQWFSEVRLRRAMREGSLITRAQGVVMAQQGVSGHQAYRGLAVRSRDEARPLVDVAREVLATADAGSGAESEAGSASSSDDVSA